MSVLQNPSDAFIFFGFEVPFLLMLLLGLYHMAIVEPQRHFPDGPPARLVRRGVRNLLLFVLALDLGSKLRDYVLLPIKPLPSPLWRLLGQFVWDGALGFIAALLAVLVLRFGVLGWHRLRAGWRARLAPGDAA